MLLKHPDMTVEKYEELLKKGGVDADSVDGTMPVSVEDDDDLDEAVA